MISTGFSMLPICVLLIFSQSIIHRRLTCPSLVSIVLITTFLDRLSIIGRASTMDSKVIAMIGQLKCVYTYPIYISHIQLQSPKIGAITYITPEIQFDKHDCFMFVVTPQNCCLYKYNLCPVELGSEVPLWILSIIHVFSGPWFLLGLCWCRTNGLGAVLPKAMSSGICPQYSSINCNDFQSFYNRKLLKGGFNLPLRFRVEETFCIWVVILGERMKEDTGIEGRQWGWRERIEQGKRIRQIPETAIYDRLIILNRQFRENDW